MLLYVNVYKDDPGNIKDVIDPLDPKGKKALYETLSGRWREEDHPKANVPTLFIDTYLGGEKIRFDKRVLSKAVLSTLMEFKEGYAEGEANKELEAINNFKEDETKRAVEAATNAIKGAPFYDPTLPLDRTKDKCVGYPIKDFDRSSLLNGISKSLPASILWRIKEEIRDKAKAKILNGFGLGDDEAKWIIGLKANVTSSLSEASFYISNGGRYAKELEALSLKDVPGAARKLSARNGAIRLSAEADTKETIVRPSHG